MANSAYRNAKRKLTAKARQIRRLMKTEKSKGYWSFIREGGAQKYLEFMMVGVATDENGNEIEKSMKLSPGVIEMFDDTCEERVTLPEIKEKLKALYKLRV